MPALLISGRNMRAGRGDSREDCSALFSVFTAEQEMRATCCMPCKQLLPGECTSSGAHGQFVDLTKLTPNCLTKYPSNCIWGILCVSAWQRGTFRSGRCGSLEPAPISRLFQHTTSVKQPMQRLPRSNRRWRWESCLTKRKWCAS